jgi:hypothetical protein
MAVIDAWIEPGTTVMSDCWGAYRDLNEQGYTHYTVNHRIGFVDQCTGAHTNTREYMASCEGLPKALQPAGGLHLSPCQLYVRSAVRRKCTHSQNSCTSSPQQTEA